ncbi:conserved hypothetical protein [Cupriavidus taiwanensis]|uniref:Uncharacterized protein n=1 Tax=Cupriavidus taiwanensis TaxID=164546 RepID=A0A976AWY9_9BURK|nr:hypothetical protein [Cupriavidus taiwanensis]SOZ55904.1 conserved hypothetical protein [Cupriavidus taiwanensis]SOZ57350.1 conserved hypothetical protein [Cupriavidus taiwanensis]SOZ59733.1 conserved hypothetical protein [Cupriavidus taiwanensis]SOZ98918.1 conserved hypothetical protein [Cupriavidus taiwanensis]SPA05823.1 conserved hypothetical protein [Cupriavidus taiwanensis]
MLTLSEAQWQALRHTEVQNFVGAVCEQFLANRTELLQRAGREEISSRMQVAYSLAAELGLLSTQHIVKFLYLCADAPQMATDLQIRAYLLKPGATPEQRLDDLSAVMKLVLKENG